MATPTTGKAIGVYCCEATFASYREAERHELGHKMCPACAMAHPHQRLYERDGHVFIQTLMGISPACSINGGYKAPTPR